MKGVARHQWIRNRYMMETCARLMDLLGRAGIPVLLLKGAAIAAAIEADPGLRSMADCDVLVPRSRALEAAEIVTSSQLMQRGKLGLPHPHLPPGLPI